MSDEDPEIPPVSKEPKEFSVTGYTSSTPKEKSDSSEEPLFKQAEGEEFSQRYDTKKLYLGIPRHLLAIALSILICGALGALATWYLLTHYKAESVLIYQEDLPKTLPGGISMNNMSLATALDLITLPAHFQAVKSILGLNLSLKEIEEMVQVPVPRNNSHLIRIVCKSDNPNLAVDIVNTLAKIAVKSSVEFTQKQLQSQIDNFKSQLDEVNQKLTKELKSIEEFKKSHQYFEMTADYTTLVTQVMEARAKLQAATLRYNSLVVEYENLKREIGNIPGELESRGGGMVGGGSSENPINGRIYSLEASLAEARAKYAPSNPKIKVLEEELKLLKEKMKGTKTKDGTYEPSYERNPSKERLNIELMRMQGKVRSAQKVKQDLSMALIEMEKDMENLPSEQITFSKLLDAKKITEEQVQFLTKALETIQLMMNVPKGSLELYELAEKGKPLRDSWWVQFLPLLGAIMGFLLGIFLAIALEMTDKKIWTIKQIELAYAIPPLTVIPELSHLNKGNSEKKTLFFIRSLAEHLEYIEGTFSKKSGPERRGQVIAFTSSTVGEGKSFLSYHLGLYYQRFRKQVLLIEFDPRPNHYSEASPTSLEAFLHSETNWKDLVIKGKPDRINLGIEEPFMKELIKTKQMTEFMEALRRAYDLIIIDAPGIIDEDYSVNLAGMADLCVFVVGSSIINKSVVSQSLHGLYRFGVKPSGIVLNRVLPVYIEDEKIKQEIKRGNGHFWEKLLFWR